MKRTCAAFIVAVVVVAPASVSQAAPATAVSVSDFATWTRQVPTPSGIAVFGRSVFVVGQTDQSFAGERALGAGDVFVQRYDVSGDLKWTRILGTDSAEFAAGITADAAGLYVAGQTSGSLDGSPNRGGTDAFVAHLSFRGKTKWLRQVGSPADDRAVAIATDASGIYLAGVTGGALGGDANEGADDMFVSRWSAGGRLAWFDQLGTAKLDWAAGVAVDATGLYLVGNTLKYPDAYSQARVGLYKLVPSSGRILWSERFGRPASQTMASDISVSPSGLYIAGNTFGLPGDSRDGNHAFIARFHRGGPLAWADQFTPPNAEAFATDIQARSSAAFAVGLAMQAEEGSTGGGLRGFLAKTSSSGRVEWVRQFGGQKSGYTGERIAGTRGAFITADQGPESGILMRVGPESLR